MKTEQTDTGTDRQFRIAKRVIDTKSKEYGMVISFEISNFVRF